MRHLKCKNLKNKKKRKQNGAFHLRGYSLDVEIGEPDQDIVERIAVEVVIAANVPTGFRCSDGPTTSARGGARGWALKKIGKKNGEREERSSVRMFCIWSAKCSGSAHEPLMMMAS